MLKALTNRLTQSVEAVMPGVQIARLRREVPRPIVADSPEKDEARRIDREAADMVGNTFRQWAALPPRSGIAALVARALQILAHIHRGDDWANNTSQQQWRRMEALMAEADWDRLVRGLEGGLGYGARHIVLNKFIDVAARFGAQALVRRLLDTLEEPRLDAWCDTDRPFLIHAWACDQAPWPAPFVTDGCDE